MSSGKFTNSTDRMLGVDGAGQVDLQSGVDGDNLIVLRDDKRVVDVIHRVALDGRVIVEEVVHGLLPYHRLNAIFQRLVKLA